MLEPEKDQDCAADKDEGGHGDVFLAQIVCLVYILFSSGEI